MTVNLDNVCQLEDSTVENLKEKVNALSMEINKGTFMSSVYIKEKANSIISIIDSRLKWAKDKEE